MDNQANISDFVSEKGSGEVPEDASSKGERYRDAEWLREQYWEKGLTQEQIGNIEGVTKNTISKWMKRLGIPRRSQSEIQADGNVAPLKSREWLEEMYKEKEHNSTKIAEMLNVSKSTVLKHLDMKNIERRTQAESLSEGNVKLLQDREYLKKKYCEEKCSSREIAEETGTCKSTVLNHLERHNIEKRSQIQAKSDGDVSKINDSDWIRNEYINKERSMSEIAEEFDVTIQAVRSALRRNSIPTRSISDAKTDTDISLLKDEEWLREQYIEKGHTLREIANKVGVSATPVRTHMSNSDIETESNVFHYEHLSHIVRSSWERRIAESLLEAGIEYEYESLEIDYGNERTYKPDFITDNYVIEVKGGLHPDRNPKQKAEAAMEHLDDAEYVVVGTELPADIHIPWEERENLLELFE